LAFATAINIDPDILIIDEALSVGDARFQQKCFSKFHEFKKSGKTILFVTHDSNAIIRHCHTAMLLEKGEIIRNGPPSEVVSDYMKLVMSKNSYRKSVSEPQLIKAIGDYNIVFFDHFYYALPKNAGKFDFYSTDPKTVSGVIYGESLNKVEHQINSDRQLKNKTMDSMPRKLTERERFFLYDETDDACNKRINYNKNEYRFGNNRAKIIDYLIESDHIINPVHLSSGKTIDLFIKIKYNTDLEKPLVGFNIKTVDGLILYGSNTRHLNHDLDPVTSGQIKIYQFTVKMDLAPGDLFIELGCSEKLPDRDIAADIRRNIIHVKLTETSIYEGLVELPMKFREVKETKDIENKVNYRTLIK
ncbi:MAG: Wzt carbohydrate-binding domain-containing protein, partial [Candidatus Zixiibacteriota bacterium]